MNCFKPLYPPDGAPCLGFACGCLVDVQVEVPNVKANLCGKVTKTERGMKMHLLRVHGIKMQSELFQNTVVEFVEGPHYPEPHRWYAQVEMKDGIVVKVK